MKKEMAKGCLKIIKGSVCVCATQHRLFFFMKVESKRKNLNKEHLQHFIFLFFALKRKKKHNKLTRKGNKKYRKMAKKCIFFVF